MSNLIKTITIPDSVRKGDICPSTLHIYDDRVECIGGANRSWFFKDYIGIDWAMASLNCAFAAVRFLTDVNAGQTPTYGVTMLSDTNRINFCSGTFSYRKANEFTLDLYKLIKSTFEDYQKNVSSSDKNATVSQSFSAADELKKFKELLDSGVITQEEFDAKKKQLLGL